MTQRVILVYTMGKVGSGTIFHTLKQALPSDKVIHTHFLSDHFLKTVLPKMDPRNTVGFKKGFEIRSYLQESQHLPLKIITLTREPISRDISDLFQKLDMYFENSEKAPSLEKLQSQMDKSLHYHPLNWFDLEFKNFTNFDIYNHHFNKSRGYTIYNTSDFDLLCIRQEDLKEIGTEALNVFLQTDIDHLISSNIRENSEVKQLYNNFRKYYQMSDTNLTQLYDSKYVRHFYSDDEIQKFKSRWTKRTYPERASDQKPKSLLLLSLARSGSSFVSALLNSHPEVEFRAEYLNVLSKETPTSEKLNTLSDFFNKKSAKRILGCSINPFKYKIDWKDLQDYITREIDYLVLLTRHNTLKQYTSIQLRLARDRKAGVPDWQSSGRGGEYGHSEAQNHLRINLDIKDAKFWIQRLNDQKNTLSSIYNSVETPKTQIIYENLLSNKNDIQDRISNLLGLDYSYINLNEPLDYLPEHRDHPSKIIFSKISPPSIKDQLTNYRDLIIDPFFKPYL